MSSHTQETTTSPSPTPYDEDVSHSSDHKKVRLCEGCELPYVLPNVPKGSNAYCSRCSTQLFSGNKSPLVTNLVLAITCLILFIPSHFFPFISIRLFGVLIPATLPSGTFTMINEGFIAVGLLILFCSSIAPFLVCAGVVSVHICLKYRWEAPFRFILHSIHYLKHWVMLDVFLISIGIACFKLQDYADITVGAGLLGVVALQLVSMFLLSKISVQRYWETWKSEASFQISEHQVHCHNCHLSQPNAHSCLRCHKALHHRKPFSIQKTWALLISASIAILPANLLPISVVITNGQRLEDTIMSGVVALIVHDMAGIAIIILFASIIIPVAKILGLFYLLLCIQFKRTIFHRQRMYIYFLVKWIGKWSVMDLFVISIMMTLLDRGQILNFSPGYGAVFFGIVVVLTMLAADSFDPRLIWDNHQMSEKSHTQPNAYRSSVDSKESNAPQSTEVVNPSSTNSEIT